jgi:hypothetical protein
MHEVHDDGDVEAQREALLSRIQFWMGVAELIFGLASIGFEVFGVAMGAAICGVIGLGMIHSSLSRVVSANLYIPVLGIVGIAIMIIFAIIFPVNEYESLQKFLEKVAENVGSYSEAKEDEEHATHP